MGTLMETANRVMEPTAPLSGMQFVKWLAGLSFTPETQTTLFYDSIAPALVFAISVQRQ
jgi:hypothetical protein